MKTKLLKKLRRRFLNHICSSIPTGGIYCCDKKYKYSGNLIRPGEFIEALHDYYRFVINYYKYIKPPLQRILKSYYKQYKYDKRARIEALNKYKIYY